MVFTHHSELLAMTWTMPYDSTYTREQPLVPSWPPRKSQNATTKRRPVGHFDPEELTRRLNIVLAEQEAQKRRKLWARQKAEAKAREGATQHRSAHDRAETRGTARAPGTDLITELRRSKSAKRQSSHAAPPPDHDGQDTAEHREYHHVPQEAARQFARTTTAENMRGGDSNKNNSSSNKTNSLINKLSQTALKYHLTDLAPIPHGSWPDNFDQPRRRGSFFSRGGTTTAEQPLEPTDPASARHPQQQRQIPNSPHTAYISRRHSTGMLLSSATLSSPDGGEKQQHQAGVGGGDAYLRRSLLGGGGAHEYGHLADVLEGVAFKAPGSPPPPPFAFPFSDLDEKRRVDWTQSDELMSASSASALPRRGSAAVEAGQGGGGAGAGAGAGREEGDHQHHRPKPLTALLRKVDSLWTLRRRPGSGGESSSSCSAGAEDGEVGVADGGGDGEAGRGKKAGFLKKLRR